MSSDSATRRNTLRSPRATFVDWVSDWGAVVLDSISTLGDMVLFAWRTMAWLFTRLPRAETLMPNYYQVGVLSLPVVALHWARREQGLLLAPGNPLRIKRLADLARGKRRFAMRQPGAGSQLLLARLARQEGISLTALRPAGPLFSSETDVAQAVANGFADGGFAIRAAAAQYGLEFLPLAWESVELALWRRTAFEAPMQTLLALTRSRRFARQAELLGGYDISGCGMVRFNA